MEFVDSDKDGFLSFDEYKGTHHGIPSHDSFYKPITIIMK